MYSLVLKRALEKAKVKLKDINLIAFSQGPGIGNCLRIGAVAARSLASILKVPILGVNHCIAHVSIGQLTSGFKDPITLYVSGANTQILALSSGRYRCFGETLDTGVGNFLDSFGRALKLGFPAGPKIEKLAKKSKKYIELPYTIKGMDFAFSGIQTKLEQLIRTKKYKKESLCFSAQETVFAELTEATERAISHVEKKEILLTGGVAANSRLQKMLKKMSKERGVKFATVPIKLAGDNGAMIAWQGILEHKAGRKQKIKNTEIKQNWRTDQVDVCWATETLKPTPKNIERAVSILKKGGIVVYPTKTSYGMAVDPLNEKAVEKLNRIKKRRKKAGYTVICSNLKQAEKYGKITKKEKELTKSKRVTTIITEKKKSWPDFVNPNFAFRIPKNKTAKKLVKEFKAPITATSANVSGEKPIYSCQEIRKIFLGRVNLILDSGRLKKKKPSRIIKKGVIVRK